MELKEGYKQTDVGVIPEDWELQELPKLYSIERNASYSRADTVNNGPVKYLHYGDIHTGLSGLIHRNEIPEEISQDYGKGYHLLCSGDVVLADASEDIEGVGAAVEIFNPNNQACIAGLHTIVLSPRDRSVAPGFGALFSKMPIVGSQFRFYAAGLKVFGLSKSNIKKVILPLPPLPEQEAIAEVLSDVDAEIESLARRQEKLVRQKQALSEELLSGRTRLVEPKSRGFKQTDVGVIPEDWELQVLRDVASVKRGGSPRPIEAFITDNPEGVNWIKIGDTTKGGKYITSTKERIRTEGTSMSREVKIGQLLLSNSMSFGRPYLLKLDGCIHDGWLVLQDFELTLDNDFFYYLLSGNQILDQYKKLAAGSGVQNLNKEVVGNVIFAFPKLTEQRAIAEVLSDVDAEIQAVAKLKAKVQTKKEGLMQTLLTGKIRLN